MKKFSKVNFAGYIHDLDNVFSDSEVVNTGYVFYGINNDVRTGNSKFAMKIFRAINKEDQKDNIFISPLSISTALTMTYNGAKSSTKEIIEKVLGYYHIDSKIVNETYQSLLNYYKNMKDGVEINIGNSIWIREGEKIGEEFLNVNKEKLNAEIAMLDFNSPSSADVMNQWISNATKGKIKYMLKPPISGDAVMFLINAIYFKGIWIRKFNPENTCQRIFYSYDGKKQTADFMREYGGKVEYAQRDGMKTIRLPYGYDKVAMYIMLPEPGSDINEVIDKMTVKKLLAIKNSLKEIEDSMIEIPKFKLEYGIKKLNDSLISIGMGEAFGGRADFSGIRDNVYISEVLHKAVIEVNEEGSEAAAATIIKIKECEPELTFYANRPFVFVIADDITNTIFFIGKVVSIPDNG